MTAESHAERKRERLPRGPSKISPEEVTANQRRRLIEAMVELSGDKGYADSTVADIIKRAGVSRKTFYEHFADRKHLLLAAFDTVSLAALQDAREAAQRGGGRTRQLESMMRRLCRFARDSPGTIALVTIEVAAASPVGMVRRDDLMGDYGDLIDMCLSTDGGGALPPTLARTLAGATHRTIDAYLRFGRTAQLDGLAPELARWARSHQPVPDRIADAKSVAPWPWVGANGLVGGRAPGTLTLAPRGYRSRVGRHSSGFVQHANRERILDSVAQLTTAHGYTTLTAESIAEHADLPERAFLAHFKSKDDAFAAALELGHAKGQALVERARASAPDWRTGVRNAVHALLEFMASEPYFTRLAFVDAPLAGPQMACRTHEHVAAYANLLLDGAPQRRRPPLVAPEAIVQALVEIAFHHAARHTVGELPRMGRQAIYLALAPFIGASEAAEAAA